MRANKRKELSRSLIFILFEIEKCERRQTHTQYMTNKTYRTETNEYSNVLKKHK